MTVLVGRFLQMVGLVLLPFALMVGLVGKNIALEVRLLFIGGIIFFIGWLMARRAA